MQELETIMEEIGVKIAGSMGRKREGLLEAQDIIRKHMNDGWIPVEKKLTLNAKYKLLPCPFCGGEAVIHVGNGVCVICKECGCRTMSFVDGTSRGKPCGDALFRVIEKWNRRAGE